MADWTPEQLADQKRICECDHFKNTHASGQGKCLFAQLQAANGYPGEPECPCKKFVLKRELICSIPCPRSDYNQPTSVYRDIRSGSWLRVECAERHLGDLGPDSCYLPEEVRQSLRSRAQRG
jgi:hypothetical protein